jgi:casein kinase 1
MRTPRRTIGSESLAKLLNQIAGLDLKERPVLGDRKNVDGALRKAKADVDKDEKEKVPIAKEEEVIVINDSSHSSEEVLVVLPRRNTPKAEQLRSLTLALAKATTNVALSDMVSKFVSVLLEANRSRTLTKEGFAFLDALYKLLADPKGCALPLRTSPRNASSDKEQVPGLEPRQAKLGMLARLRRDVGQARSNRQLAKMLADFGEITNRSSGRTVTKDGFAFLEGLAGRLKVI